MPRRRLSNGERLEKAVRDMNDVDSRLQALGETGSSGRAPGDLIKIERLASRGLRAAEASVKLSRRLHESDDRIRDLQIRELGYSVALEEAVRGLLRDATEGVVTDPDALDKIRRKIRGEE